MSPTKFPLVSQISQISQGSQISCVRQNSERASFLRRSRLVSRALAGFGVALGVLGLGGCSGSESDDGAEGGLFSRPPAPATAPDSGSIDDEPEIGAQDPLLALQEGTEFVRALVFVSLPGDTATVSPWVFRTTPIPAGTRRERGVWFARNGSWETLGVDTLRGPASRSPWRILPGGPIRLVVGAEDAVESLIFDAPPRVLELEPGRFLAEWTPETSSIWRIEEGTLRLPVGITRGLVLDLTRSRSAGAPGSLDWGFLHGGTELQLLLQELPPTEPQVDGRTSPPATSQGGRFRMWIRVNGEERSWEEVRVQWREVRPFDRARRDVPVVLQWSAPQGVLDPPFSGTLRVVSSSLSVGDGDGPVLPILGFLEVEGTVALGTNRFSVRGVIRHLRP